MHVSVLIPAYNAAEFISETLQSCLLQGQEYVKEIIVIDDNSTDDTSKIVQEIRNNNETKIQIIYKLNESKGACSARNKALKISSGEYIQWIDADDILGPRKIAKQYDSIKSQKDTLAVCEWQRFNSMDGELFKREKFWLSTHQTSTPLSWIQNNPMTIPACWLGSKTIFQAAGEWDETLQINQDGEYFTRVVSKARGLVVSNSIRVLYRSGLNNSVSRMAPSKIPSLYKTTESYENVILEMSKSRESEIAVANMYQSYIYRSYPHHPELLSKANQKLNTLPPPNIEPDMLISPFSKWLASLVGWKMIVRMRLIRSYLMHSLSAETKPSDQIN